MLESIHSMVINPKIQKLNLAYQQGYLKKLYPSSFCKIDKSQLEWIYNLHPTPISIKYRIRLLYKLNKIPEIYILDPKLKTREGEKIPHMFTQSKLGLFFSREWKGNQFIAETIVPWISEWLLFYEIWYSTGTWCGGGIHPNINKEEFMDEE